MVLYAGEYGYHTGNILWRGHFNASSAETAFKVKVMGGAAFGYSVWLDATFIGSWEGNAVRSDYEGTFKFPTKLTSGSTHIITILQDHMGYEEDWIVASETFRAPRGILSYSFIGSSSTAIDVWKVTGNLGGESVRDRQTVLNFTDLDDSMSTGRVGRSTKVVYMPKGKVGISLDLMTHSGLLAYLPPAYPNLVLTFTGRFSCSSLMATLNSL